MASYRFCFIDGSEYVINQIDIEAKDDADVMALAWAHSIRTNLAVEVWDTKGLIARTNPVAARLLADCDDQAA